jgi:hypothetical protein
MKMALLISVVVFGAACQITPIGTGQSLPADPANEAAPAETEPLSCAAYHFEADGLPGCADCQDPVDDAGGRELLLSPEQSQSSLCLLARDDGPRVLTIAVETVNCSLQAIVLCGDCLQQTLLAEFEDLQSHVIGFTVGEGGNSFRFEEAVETIPVSGQALYQVVLTAAALVGDCLVRVTFEPA